MPVTIRAKNGKVDFAQLSVAQLPEFGPAPPSPADLATCLRLDAGEILFGEFAPEAVSCGVPFCSCPLKDRKTLARARVRLDDFERVLGGYWTSKVFVFCDDPELRDSDYRARMFAPTSAFPRILRPAARASDSVATSPSATSAPTAR